MEEGIAKEREIWPNVNGTANTIIVTETKRVGRSRLRSRRGQWNKIAFRCPLCYEVSAFMRVRPRSRPIASSAVSISDPTVGVIG